MKVKKYKVITWDNDYHTITSIDIYDEDEFLRRKLDNEFNNWSGEHYIIEEI